MPDAYQGADVVSAKLNCPEKQTAVIKIMISDVLI
jgi:hypothetical protein